MANAWPFALRLAQRTIRRGGVAPRSQDGGAVQAVPDIRKIFQIWAGHKLGRGKDVLLGEGEWTRRRIAELLKSSKTVIARRIRACAVSRGISAP
jgi:hypothetical protein